MNSDYESVSKSVLDLTEAVGMGITSAEAALIQLQAVIRDRCILEGIGVWQVACMGAEVLALLVPAKKDAVLIKSVNSDEGEYIPPEVLTAIMIRVIMRGIERHYKKGDCTTGAAALLAACPNLIPKTSTPFDDSKKARWNTSQQRFEIR